MAVAVLVSLKSNVVTPAHLQHFYWFNHSRLALLPPEPVIGLLQPILLIPSNQMLLPGIIHILDLPHDNLFISDLLLNFSLKLMLK